jgi:hypothetical protein
MAGATAKTRGAKKAFLAKTCTELKLPCINDDGPVLACTGCVNYAGMLLVRPKAKRATSKNCRTTCLHPQNDKKSPDQKKRNTCALIMAYLSRTSDAKKKAAARSKLG